MIARQMYMPKFYQIIIISFFLFLLADISFAQKGTRKKLESATLVWVTNVKDSFELIYAYYENGSWGKAKQLTDSGFINYIPTLTEDAKGKTWVVWSARMKEGFKLYYAILNRGIVEQPPKRIKTGMSSNIGPHLATEKDGTPILVWAGNNGKNDDVYLSRWDGSQWSRPLRINKRNSTPDYLPKIYVDLNGSASVEWKAMSPSGQTLKLKNLETSEIKNLEYSVNSRIKRKADKVVVDSCLHSLPGKTADLEMTSSMIHCLGDERAQQVMYLKKYIQSN